MTLFLRDRLPCSEEKLVVDDASRALEGLSIDRSREGDLRENERLRYCEVFEAIDEAARGGQSELCQPQRYCRAISCRNQPEFDNEGLV